MTEPAGRPPNPPAWCGDTEDPWRPWSRAASFAELAELAARFLEGELEAFPGWGAPDVDEESDPIVRTLARCCRAGFLTVASQPAGAMRPGADGRCERRRAFVSGFASSSAATRLGTLRSRGLRVAIAPARVLGTDPGPPVGLRDREPFLFAGHGAGPIELELFAGRCSDEAVAALTETSWVVVHDPDWDRDDRLWSALHGVS